MNRIWIGAILMLALAGMGGRQLESNALHVEDGTELTLYPSGRMLELTTLGQPTLLADLAWLQAIQYYGKHRKEDRRYPHARHLFDLITTVDPSFRTAYIFGALVLEEEEASLESARELLARGICSNPADWMLRFQRGFLEYLRGDLSVGASEMLRASRLPGAPPYAGRLAAHACGRSGRVDLAIRIWEELARQSADPAMRTLAEERLRRLRSGSYRWGSGDGER